MAELFDGQMAEPADIRGFANTLKANRSTITIEQLSHQAIANRLFSF
jgi:hypothetical protein